MILLNFYGSSHISEKHGLQTAIKAGFHQMDGVFKTKFELNWMGRVAFFFIKHFLKCDGVYTPSHLKCDGVYMPSHVRCDGV